MVVAVPASVALPLLDGAPQAAVPPSMRQFLSAQKYRPSLHVSFLCRVTEFKKHPTHATIVPRLLPRASSSTAQAQTAPDVAYVTFPSGRLQAPAPPGMDIIVVYLTAKASARLLPCLQNPELPLPPAPQVKPGVSRVPDWLTRQVEGKGSKKGTKSKRVEPPPMGAVAGLSARQLQVADHVWNMARRDVPGPDLPGVYCDVAAVYGWEHGWCAQDPGGVSVCSASEHVQRQLKSGSNVVVAGDFLGAGTAEGAARSGLWAAASLSRWA